ncbi:MAG: SpoIIE family protein phosphatase [Flavobacteriales bacterium]
MRSGTFTLWLVLLLLTVPANVQAQGENGLLNIRNYSPKEYGAHPQNFCFTQDDRGIMYAGNNRGILQYDGYRWKLYKTRNEAAVTSLLADKNNRIWVGGINEIGYLEADSAGKLEYHSMLEKLPKGEQSFDKILRIHKMGDARVFQTREFIFIYRNGRFETIKPGRMGLSFFVHTEVYFNLADSGLHVFNGKNITPVTGGNVFKGVNLYGVAGEPGNLLVCTANKIYRQQENTFVEVDKNIPNIYNLEALGKQYYAFGLFGDGILITDRNLNKRYSFGLQNGLQDGTINSVFLDRENNLWVALNRGIDKIEVFSPINTFNHNIGLKGAVESIIRHKSVLYVATYNGVFYFDRATQRFSEVGGLSSDCYGLCEFVSQQDTMLFVAANNGVYKIENKTATLLTDGIPWNVFQSKQYLNRLFIGQDDGLSSMVYINGIWKEEKRIDGISDPVSSLEEDEKYTWIGSRNSGVYRIVSKTYASNTPEWKKYGKKENLPDGWTFVCEYEDKVLFGTSDGIYEFDEQKDRFVRSKLNPVFSNKKFGIHKIKYDEHKRLWLSVFYEKDNTYDICYYEGGAWKYKPFLKYNSDIVQTMFLEDKQAWLGTAFGLMRYDYSTFIRYFQPVEVVISRAFSRDEPIFNGFFMKANGEPSVQQRENTILSYSSNNLTFEFSATSFSDEASTKYQYFLKGHSREWSNWSSVPTASFTNLGEGDYTMMIKARNIYGQESAITNYRFTILPPWHRTWWAYTLYALFFIAFVYMAIRVSTRGLKRIIEERTAEVVHQKELVEEKNKDILDSIKYAKRIQEAMIPSAEIMREEISKELFVFYRPKDIVSGDFYWMRPTHEGVLFAAVDCTGHGVPGAFVSIIGNNGLNRAVNEFGLRKPGEILDKLSALTEEAFRQQGNTEVKDGMDCSLVLYHKNENTIEFSGANNPLWIIRKNASSGIPEVIEYKADKQPIGKFDGRKPFKTHIIQLQKGDAFYLFSDGYADQFGGDGGKKFKYKQLKDILVSIHEKSMDIQEKVLVESFDNWKGEYEQLDDVCLIGVKAR